MTQKEFIKNNKRKIAGTLTGVMALSLVGGVGIHKNPVTGRIEIGFGQTAYAFEDDGCVTNLDTTSYSEPVFKHKDGSTSLATDVRGEKSFVKLTNKDETLIDVQIYKKDILIAYKDKSKSTKFRIYSDLTELSFKEIPTELTFESSGLSNGLSSPKMVEIDMSVLGGSKPIDININSGVIRVVADNHKLYYAKSFSAQCDSIKRPENVVKILGFSEEGTILQTEDGKKYVCGIQNEPKLFDGNIPKNKSVAVSLVDKGKGSLNSIMIQSSNLGGKNIYGFNGDKEYTVKGLTVKEISTSKNGFHSIVRSEDGKTYLLDLENKPLEKFTDSLGITRTIELRNNDDVKNVSVIELGKNIKDIIPTSCGYTYIDGDTDSYHTFIGLHDSFKNNGYTNYDSWVAVKATSDVQASLNSMTFDKGVGVNLEQAKQEISKFVDSKGEGNVDRIYKKFRTLISVTDALKKAKDKGESLYTDDVALAKLSKDLKGAISSYSNTTDRIYKVANYLSDVIDVNLNPSVSNKYTLGLYKGTDIFADNTYGFKDDLSTFITTLAKGIDASHNKKIADSVRSENLSFKELKLLQTKKQGLSVRPLEINGGMFYNLLPNYTVPIDNLVKLADEITGAKDFTTDKFITDYNKLEEDSKFIPEEAKKDSKYTKITKALALGKQKIEENSGTIADRLEKEIIDVFDKSKEKEFTVDTIHKDTDVVKILDKLVSLTKYKGETKQEQLKKTYKDILDKLDKLKVGEYIADKISKLKEKQTSTPVSKEEVGDVLDRLYVYRDIVELTKGKGEGGKLIDSCVNSLLNIKADDNVKIPYDVDILEKIKEASVGKDTSEVVDKADLTKNKLISSDVDMSVSCVENILRDLDKNVTKPDYLNSKVVDDNLAKAESIAVKLEGYKNLLKGKPNSDIGKVTTSLANIEKIRKYASINPRSLNKLTKVLNNFDGRPIPSGLFSSISTQVDKLPEGLEIKTELTKQVEALRPLQDTEIVKSLKTNIDSLSKEIKELVVNNKGKESNPTEYVTAVKDKIKMARKLTKDLNNLDLSLVTPELTSSGSELTESRLKMPENLTALVELSCISDDIDNTVKNAKDKPVSDEVYNIYKEDLKVFSSSKEKYEEVLSKLDKELLPLTVSSKNASIAKQVKDIESQLEGLDESSVLNGLSPILSLIDKLPTTDIEKDKVTELETLKVEATDILGSYKSISEGLTKELQKTDDIDEGKLDSLKQQADTLIATATSMKKDGKVKNSLISNVNNLKKSIESVKTLKGNVDKIKELEKTLATHKSDYNTWKVTEDGRAFVESLTNITSNKVQSSSSNPFLKDYQSKVQALESDVSQAETTSAKSAPAPKKASLTHEQEEKLKSVEALITKAEQSKSKEDIEKAREAVKTLTDEGFREKVGELDIKLDSLTSEGSVSVQPGTFSHASLSSIGGKTEDHADLDIYVDSLPNISIKSDVADINFGNVDLMKDHTPKEKVGLTVESNMPYTLNAIGLRDFTRKDKEPGTIDVGKLSAQVDTNGFQVMSKTEEKLMAESNDIGKKSYSAGFKMQRDNKAKPGIYSTIIRFIARQK